MCHCEVYKIQINDSSKYCININILLKTKIIHFIFTLYSR